MSRTILLPAFHQIVDILLTSVNRAVLHRPLPVAPVCAMLWAALIFVLRDVIQLARRALI